MTGCVCELAGFCERHKINKSPHLLDLCQSHESYFNAWEEGKGPGQPKIKSQPKSPMTKKRKPKPEPSGPGTELKLILAEKGYSVESGCGCTSKAGKMDAWGPAKCRKRISEITEWLVDAAKKHNWMSKIAVSTPVASSIAKSEIRKLIELAIERAEAKLEIKKLEDMLKNQGLL